MQAVLLCTHEMVAVVVGTKIQQAHAAGHHIRADAGKSSEYVRLSIDVELPWRI